MIAQIFEEACTNCATCVTVCPTLVLEEGAKTPVIARADACQTCYMCEVYCPSAAIYVAPDQFARESGPFPLAAANLGVIRHDHGWDRPGEGDHLAVYGRLGPLLGEGVEIATRRYARDFGEAPGRGAIPVPAG